MYEEGRTVISKNPFLNENEKSNSKAYLIEIRGNDIGYSFPLDDDITIVGRASDSSLMLFSDSVSRIHLTISKVDDNTYIIKDNNSTNGVYINNVKIQEATLRDADIIKIGDFGFKFLDEYNDESQYHKELYNLKNFDSLTQVYNKRYFNSRLEYEFERVSRYNKELSYVIMDIDFFKKVNDTYGHVAGDYVLKDFAKIIKSVIRKTDILGRVGGEEFAIIIPETSKMGAVILAEKVRRLVESHDFMFKASIIPVTVSMGVISMSNFEIIPTLNNFIEKADDLLYLAKDEGRNQVRYL